MLTPMAPRESRGLKKDSRIQVKGVEIKTLVPSNP
jgi:hypothetical protein